MIGQLAEAAGAGGMIAGQMADLQAEIPAVTSNYSKIST